MDKRHFFNFFKLRLFYILFLFIEFFNFTYQ